MNGEGPLVLVVDDEEDLRKLLEFNLQSAGFRTGAARTGSEALGKARTVTPDIILLDLNLPDVSGLDVCRSLKADPLTKTIPVLMLTARTSEADRLDGFDVGAEDYVTKPFSVRELISRLNVIRRRLGGHLPVAQEKLVRTGSIELDLSRYVARVNGSPIELTLLEFRLLAFLVEAQGRVCTRGDLLRHVWGYPAESETRTIETHVKRLRAKLGAAGDDIETVRSVGYRFRTE